MNRQETLKLSSKPLFVVKTRAIAGEYLDPAIKAMVLYVDEKSQFQALHRPQPVLPLAHRAPERSTHDYMPHGAMTLLAAFDIATRDVIGRLYRRHRSPVFLKTINRQLPEALGVDLVMDNYVTHKTQTVKNLFVRHLRIHAHFTPTSASWSDQVARRTLTQKQITRGTHCPTLQLEQPIRG